MITIYLHKAENNAIKSEMSLQQIYLTQSQRIHMQIQ